jgi:hypothetical protein
MYLQKVMSKNIVFCWPLEGCTRTWLSLRNFVHMETLHLVTTIASENHCNSLSILQVMVVYFLTTVPFVARSDYCRSIPK